MDGCRAQRRQMMRYLDNELDAEEAILFDEHLKECPLCASFVERSRTLDELFERTLAPSADSAQSAAFVDRILERVDGSAGGRAGRNAIERSSTPALGRIIWPIAAAAAAVGLLLWAFSATSRELTPDRAPSEPFTSDVDDRIETLRPKIDEPRPTAALRLPSPPVSAAARDEAYAELNTILTALDALPGEKLGPSFEEKTRSLRDRSWRVNVMLVGALRREEGPALRSAIRLVEHLAGSRALPDVSHSLKRLIDEGRFSTEAMAALRALGTGRAVAALGDLLGELPHRDAALGMLSSIDSDDAVRQIVSRTQTDADRGALSEFGTACIRTLSRMGRPGILGIVESCARSGKNHGFARAIVPPSDEFAALLVEILPELEGARLMAGLDIAAALRIDGAVDVIRNRFRDREVRQVGHHLAAKIGGPHAARLLVELYEGPLSLRERKELNAALCAIFEHFPQELESTMAALFETPESGGGEVFIEMLSQGTTRGACRALSWIVEECPLHAPDAALSLARTGSDAALEELLRILSEPKLGREARVAAAAAAFHLGGPAILDRIKKSLESDQEFLADSGDPDDRRKSAHRRSRLTQTGFRKLQNYILKQTE